MTKKSKIIEELDQLSADDWADVVGTAAQKRYESMRQSNSNAATFYDISRACSRLRKILKRINIA